MLQRGPIDAFLISETLGLWMFLVSKIDLLVFCVRENVVVNKFVFHARVLINQLTLLIQIWHTKNNIQGSPVLSFVNRSYKSKIFQVTEHYEHWISIYFFQVEKRPAKYDILMIFDRILSLSQGKAPMNIVFQHEILFSLIYKKSTNSILTNFKLIQDFLNN